MTRITKHLPTIKNMVEEADRIGIDEFIRIYRGYEGYSSEHDGSIEFLSIFFQHQNRQKFMGQMKELFTKMEHTQSVDLQHDEDYIYEQYLLQEKLNEEYWEQRSIEENDPEYFPTPEEEEENFQQTQKQNGNIK